MALLERDAYLNDMHGLLAQATRGHGCMLFLSGEAGVGKTTLMKSSPGRLGRACAF